MKSLVVLLVSLVSFAAGAWTNGALWYDTNGHVVNAHGGGVLTHKGRFYLYGEHKIYSGRGNRAHAGVHMYSSTDLETWKDEGLVLQVEDKPGSDIDDGCILERPKIVHCAKTGKFVMFFHLELKGRGYNAARTGIAVADKVTGPYAFQRSLSSFSTGMSASSTVIAMRLKATNPSVMNYHSIYRRRRMQS